MNYADYCWISVYYNNRHQKYMRSHVIVNITSVTTQWLISSIIWQQRNGLRTVTFRSIHSDVIIVLIKTLLGLTIRSRVSHLLERGQVNTRLEQMWFYHVHNYNNLLFPNETLYNSEVSLNFVPSGITMNSVACLKKGAAQWKLKDQACTSFRK